MLTARHRSRGFTLIELMIGLVILGILVAAAMPAYNTWIANTQIRNLAESLQNGIRLAQAEATKRNRDVQFVLTAGSPSADPPLASPTGKNWVVRDVDPATPSAERFVQGAVGTDGSPNTALSCAGTCPTGFDGTIGFNGLGRVIPATLSAELRLKICNPNGGDRPLGIVVSTAGSVRMCNPRFGAADPQGCPASFTCP